MKGLCGGVLKYAAQKIPQVDPPEAEKRATYGWKLVVKCDFTVRRFEWTEEAI